MKRNPPYLLFVFGVFAWCFLLLVPTLMSQFSVTQGYASIIHQAFSHICHQKAERSLFLGETQLAVCARCSAIYFGFLIGVVVTPFVFRRRLILGGIVPWLLCAAPMLVDVLLDLSGIHSSTMFTRIITGGIFGIAAGLILIPHIIALNIRSFKLLFRQAQGVHS